MEGTDTATSTSLEGRVALVTGASRGIGRAIALALAGAGADVAVNFRERAAGADAVCARVREIGRRAAAVGADVSVAEQVSEMVGAVRRELGPISILVNNAGITRPEPVERISEASWDAVLDTNLKSMFLVTQAALSDMRAARWGRIVNLSSVAAQLGGIVGPHYAASKAGVLGLTHSYAAILAAEGITVNAIAPALIESSMTDANPRAKPGLIPVGRLGRAEEVAEIAVALCRNGYVTGQTFNVNGGWYMS